MTATAPLPAQGAPIGGQLREYTIRRGTVTRTVVYPSSPMMDGVVSSVLEGEYHFLPFVAAYERPVIVDVGANVGTTAMVFGTLYPHAVIHAVEPSRSALPFLEHNAARATGVHVHRHGLFDRTMVARLYVGKEATVTSSLGESGFNTAEYDEVPLVRATEFVEREGIEEIALLKIDTEGAELPILRDLDHRLHHVGAIMLEYHSEHDRLEIDSLLRDRFTLFQGAAICPHRGTLTYAAHHHVAGTPQAGLEIKPIVLD